MLKNQHFVSYYFFYFSKFIHYQDFKKVQKRYLYQYDDSRKNVSLLFKILSKKVNKK